MGPTVLGLMGRQEKGVAGEKGYRVGAAHFGRASTKKKFRYLGKKWDYGEKKREKKLTYFQ